MTVTQGATELAEILSPSQVRCFMDCQMRWWFKYGLKLPDPQNGKLALGKAVHAALTANFAQKIESYEDLPDIGVRALFREAWASECERTEFSDDEDPAELRASGEGLIQIFMDQVAPHIEPVATEVRVEGQIGGVTVQGWIDVMDIDGRIIEIKTAARRPQAIAPDHKFQLATYLQLTPGARGTARVDTLVKTKVPALITQEYVPSDADFMATRKLYALAQETMRKELFMPNRLSLNCSRRNCSYWRCCEQEWGGEVPEK